MSAPWVASVMAAVLSPESSGAGASLAEEALREMREQGASILQLVGSLGPVITSEEDSQRARAMSFLAHAMTCMEWLVRTETDVNYLSQYFASHFEDWPTTGQALRGWSELFERCQPSDASQPPPLWTLSDVLVLSAADAFSHNVFLRSMSALDRLQGLRFLRGVLERRGELLTRKMPGLAETVVAAVDGEKDPRCLLQAFACVRALLEAHDLCADDAQAQARLEAGGADLFDVLACYFPVLFTPRAGDDGSITREDLAQ
ncbi:hypothetical protein H632_c3270p0, partial [Helicosporidium sp. ATCC 50920]